MRAHLILLTAAFLAGACRDKIEPLPPDGSGVDEESDSPIDTDLGLDTDTVDSDSDTVETDTVETPDTDVIDTDVIDTDVIDTDVIDTTLVDTDVIVDTTLIDTDPPETGPVLDTSVDTDLWNDSFGPIDSDTSGVHTDTPPPRETADTSETDDTTPPSDDTDTTPPSDDTDTTPPSDDTDTTPPVDTADTSETGESDTTPPSDDTDTTPPSDDTDTTPPSDDTDTTPPSDDTDTTPPSDDTDTTPPSDDTDTTPPSDDTDTTPPVDDTDPPADDTDTTPPSDDTDTTPPLDTTDTSETGESDTTPPSDDTDTTPPSDDTDTTPPSDDTDTTPPSDDTDTTPPSDDTDTTPPSDDTDTTPPSDDTDTTPPADDTDTTPPADDTDTTPPADDTDTTPPSDDTDTTPPADDTDTTPPADDTDTTPPADDTDTTPPVDTTDTAETGETDTTPPADDTDTVPVETDAPIDTDTVETDTPVDTDTVDTDTPVDTDTGLCGHEPPTISWPLPGASFPGTGTFDDLSSELDCPGNTETPAYELLDIDGDGLRDLVVTDECDLGGGGDVGERHWLVWFNTGTGFEANPAEWDVPGRAYAGDETLDTITGELDCNGQSETPSWTTLDIDGDGAPELIITDICDAPDIGETRWLVYANTGTGFAARATDWLLPGNQFPGDETFDLFEAQQDCGGGDEKPTYGLFDHNGDDLPDLVITDECTTGGVGETSWTAYNNTGTRFAANPRTLTLPGAGYDGDESFDDFFSELDCNGADTEAAYSLVDMNGDGLADLLVTDLCEAGGGGSVGETEWLVHPNLGTGFGDVGLSWSVPGALYAGNETLDEPQADQDCGGAEPQPAYGLRDLDGDGRPELVVVDTCEANGDVGELWWDYYSNTGAGFAPSAERWAVPGADYAGAETFDAFSSESDCRPGVSQPAYDLADLDGDGSAELIILDTCTDPTTGDGGWVISYPTCAVGI